MILNKEINVIQTIDKTMFLICIDLECLTMTSREVSDSLIGEIDFHLCLRIILNTLEEFAKELLTYLYWQNEIIQFVVLVNISKETADDHPETITGDSPCSMVSGRT